MLSQLVMHQGIYELADVKEPSYDNGRLTTATADRRGIAERYILGFFNDCFPDEKDPAARCKEIVERRLENGSMYFWENSEGEIVSTASKSRESKHAATISLVYTPEELRGKGYASRLVAQLSKNLLQEGRQRCNLFTDLNNSTSNSIYQKIGYKFLGESVLVNFCKP
jgi:predicted GNAT family acetyltransferase